jgi:hypothetical protein
MLKRLNINVSANRLITDTTELVKSAAQKPIRSITKGKIRNSGSDGKTYQNVYRI